MPVVAAVAVGLVVATDVSRFTLDSEQLGNDGLLLLGERPGDGRERLGRRRGRERVANREPTGDEIRSEGRLEPVELLGGEDFGATRGPGGCPRRGLALRLLRLATDVQQPRWFSRNDEPGVACRKCAVLGDRRAIEPGEDHVEGMLDDARIPPRRPCCDRDPLVQADAGSGLGEEGRRGAPDDPAADDGDVRPGPLPRHRAPNGNIEPSQR